MTTPSSLAAEPSSTLDRVHKRGQVITFYSYKGGTGRSMALANVACLLAQRHDVTRGVLMVDWDLEAPGLHRFFRDRFRNTLGDEPTSATKLDNHDGLIELMMDLDRRTREGTIPKSEPEEPEDIEVFSGIDLNRYVLPTDINSLSLLKAGNFNADYAAHVNTFPWEAFYKRAPWLLGAFARYLAKCYDYVLIDSRTGLTDISGICTSIMPEKLVAVFTPNRQSLIGAIDVVRLATKYRRTWNDLRPLMVFPVPSRIDVSEPKRRDAWRLGDTNEGVVGYQEQFEKLFSEIYDLRLVSLSEYFSTVAIPHISPYAYGEEIAVLIERSADRFSLTGVYQSFTDWLMERGQPWTEQQVSVRPEADEEKRVLGEAERIYAGLEGTKDAGARSLLTRLVTISARGDPEAMRRARVPRSALDPDVAGALRAFVGAGLVVADHDPSSDEPSYQLASDALLEWPTLRLLVEQDREFLLWRQLLDEKIAEWEAAKRNPEYLLTGDRLQVGLKWSRDREAKVNESERSYLTASLTREQNAQRLQVVVGGVVLIALGILLTALGFLTTLTLALRWDVTPTALAAVADYPYLGVRAALPSVIWAALWSVLFLVARRLWSLMRARRPAAAPSHSSGRKWTPGGIAETFVIAEVVAIGLFVVGFWRLLHPIIDPKVDPRLLGCDFRWVHYSYSITASLLWVATAYAWVKTFVTAGAPARKYPVLRLAGGLLVLVMMLISGMPWRTLYDADRPRVWLNRHRAYRIADSSYYDAEDRRTYVSGSVQVQFKGRPGETEIGYVFEEAVHFTEGGPPCR